MPFQRTLVCLLLASLALPVSVSAGQVDNSDRLILVTGATGQQGGAVARELLRRGYKVRGLTRDPLSDASKALSALGVEMVKGNFNDPPSLDAALEGAYGAYSVQNWVGIGAEGEIRHGKAVADAAKRAGVAHFVYSSAAAASSKTNVPFFDSKRAIEDHIKAIGLPYTIIRPASFMSNFSRDREAILEGIYRTPFPPRKVNQYIAVSDIGRFVAEAFDKPQAWIGRSIDIAGDEKTYTEVAEIFTRVLGRPVEYQQIPWNEFTEQAPPPVITMADWFRDNDHGVDIANLRKEFPWMLTLEEYLRRSGWQDDKSTSSNRSD